MTDMPIADSILDTIGHTPLVRLSRIGAGLRPQLLAKLEVFNPGGSIKDRVAVAMIEAAERDGRLRPGGTIVEPTSGNTGTGLAIAARLKGYRVMAVMPDKMSREKIDLLRAYGAEVVLAPTDVPPDSPRSYYRVADRLTAEIPGAFQPNQYANEANPRAHYESTGPELWEQTGGRITHLVVGVGTGGTITGTVRYLRERRPGPRRRRRRPGGLDLLRRRGERPPVPGRGRRRGLLAGHVRPGQVVDRWVTVSDRDCVPDHAPAGPGRGDPRRRLRRPGPARRARRSPREIEDPEAMVVVILPGRRPLVPVEDLLRRLDAPVRLPGARLGPDRRRRAAPQARGRRVPGAGHRPAPLPRSARRSRSCTSTASRSCRWSAPTIRRRSSAPSASAACCGTPPRIRRCSTPRSPT